MQQGDQKRTVLFELADVLLKSWWTLVASVCVGLVGALVVLHVVPSTFQASTMVRIAPPSIPERMLDTTVTEDIAQRLFAVQESILSREYLSRVLEKHFGLPSGPEALETQVNALRSRIDVVTDRRALMFSLAYRDSDPEQCAAVVNTLTRLYVDENAEFRTRRASETAGTFEDMAEGARLEAETAAERVNRFKSQHPFETERDLELNMRQKETAQNEIESKRNERLFAQERLTSLEERRRAAVQSIASSSPIVGVDPTLDPNQRRMAELQAELDRLRTRYTPNHPSVREAERQLAALREQVGGTPAEPGAPPPTDPRLSVFDADIERLKQEIAQLQADEQRLQRDIADIERRIRITPETQRQLTELENVHELAQRKYEDLRGKAEDSRDSVFLETEQKGARLEVLEWAVVPFIPVSPKPLQVFPLSILGGLVLFVGPLVVGTLLNPVIRSEAGLRAVAAGVPVLIDIPRIATREIAGLNQRRWLKNIVLSVLSAAVLVAAVFTL